MGMVSRLARKRLEEERKAKQAKTSSSKEEGKQLTLEDSCDSVTVDKTVADVEEKAEEAAPVQVQTEQAQVAALREAILELRKDHPPIKGMPEEFVDKFLEVAQTGRLESTLEAGRRVTNLLSKLFVIHHAMDTGISFNDIVVKTMSERQNNGILAEWIDELRTQKVQDVAKTVGMLVPARHIKTDPKDVVGLRAWVFLFAYVLGVSDGDVAGLFEEAAELRKGLQMSSEEAVAIATGVILEADKDEEGKVKAKAKASRQSHRSGSSGDAVIEDD